jgi:hypothetical protein
MKRLRFVRSTIERTTRAWRPGFGLRRASVFALIASALVLVFSGGTCVVVYCSEDCDPCLVDTCKCSQCSHHAPDFEASHRLEGFTSSVLVDADDRVTRIYAHILGLSLDRALGVRPHTEIHAVQFARDVLRTNIERFPSRASEGGWSLDGVQRIDRSTIVTFHDGDERASNETRTATVTFLFDARGNLVEIDHALR